MGQNLGNSTDTTAKISPQESSPAVVSTGAEENMSSDSENEEDGLEEQSPVSDTDVKEEERVEGSGRESVAKSK